MRSTSFGWALAVDSEMITELGLLRCSVLQEVSKQMRGKSEETSHYNYYPFSTVQLNDILSHFSEVNLKNIVVGYLVMVSRWRARKQSTQCWTTKTKMIVFFSTVSVCSNCFI